MYFEPFPGDLPRARNQGAVMYQQSQAFAALAPKMLLVFLKRQPDRNGVNL